MATILTAVAIMTGLALFFGVVLAVAYRTLRVEEDPRIDQLEDLLAGANCGACGAPGCRAFAERLVEGEALPAQCTVSSPETIAAMAALLGVEAGQRTKRVARLHCAGGRSVVRRLATYRGLSRCAAAALVGSGGSACAWGCLGLGDCAEACTFDAIWMSSEELPVVDVEACTACGDCVTACPKALFSIEPLEQRLVVQCSSPLAGELAREICSLACDACGRCAVDSSPGVIEMEGGLPVIRVPDKTTIEATFRCPTGAIRWVEGRQFETMEANSSQPKRRARA